MNIPNDRPVNKFLAASLLGFALLYTSLPGYSNLEERKSQHYLSIFFFDTLQKYVRNQ